MNGSPVRPSGHLQTALWLLIVHNAVDAHGLDTVHGFTHWRFRHESVGWQSLLEEQPTEVGTPKLPYKIYFNRL
jgi:hypothetical protein